MKTIRFDSVGGASGNMIMGALLDLGVPQAPLLEALHGLAIEHTKITIEPKSEHGQRGTLVTVHHDEGHHPPHRHLSHVVKIIQDAPVSEATKTLSAAVFRRLAEAEAKVHGTTPEAVHFHEVGAIDAIIDIVGCCMCLELLEIDAVIVGPLPLGTGTIRCAHGVMPVPVPATVELLTGFKTVQTDVPTELVTPTGAALLTTWALRLPPPPADACHVVSAAGNGFGHKTLGSRSNLLRATLLLSDGNEHPPHDTCLMLECNIDDSSPEVIGALTEQLLAAGSLDVFVTPVQMKKHRPGVLLSVLCAPEQKMQLQDLIFAESTTFGIREHAVTRTILDRRHETVETPFGRVRLKIGSRNGDDLTISPEFEDCLAAAREHHAPLADVYTAARVAWANRT